MSSKRYKIIILMLMMLMVISKVKAFEYKTGIISQGGSWVSDTPKNPNKGYGLAVKKDNNYIYICTKYKKRTPAGQNISCILNDDWDEKVRIGVAAIIDASKSGYASTKVTENYFAAEMAINRFLYEKNGQKDNELDCEFLQTTAYKQKCNEYLKVAREAYNNANLDVNFSVESTNLNFKRSGDNYISDTIRVTTNVGYKVTSNIGSVHVNGDSFYVEIPLSSLSAVNNVNVTVTSGVKEYSIARNYSCGDVNTYQTITPNYTEKVTTEKKAVTLTGTILGNGKLVIRKVDGNTKKGISNVIFILEGTDRVCTTNVNGECVIDNLPAGKYILREKQPARFYPSNNNRWTIQINAGETNDYYYNKPIENTKTCVSEFEDDVNKRLALYKEKYSNFNNLLNFNIHSAEDACKKSTCKKSPSISCMNFSSGNLEFNEYNLSCYDDTIDINGVTGYCIELFDFQNILGISGTYNFGTINSGQLIIKQNISKIGIGTLKKICYLPNIVNGYTGVFNYSDYVKSVKLGDFLFNNDDKSFELSYEGVFNGFKKLSAIVDSEYNLPSVSSSIGNGKKYYSESCTNCRFLGYGLISNLASRDGEYNLKFGIELNINNLKNTIETNDSCKYNIKNKITTCEDKTCKSNKLNLEFRIIDTSNPFPGKSGSSRKTGENWCDTDSCSSKNQNVCTNIINKKNSYTSGTAKYTITFTPDVIRQIRKDNSTNKKNGISYDDFSTLNCDENNNCTSNYLKELEGRTVSDKSNSTYVLVRAQDYKSNLDVINEECRTK